MFSLFTFSNYSLSSFKTLSSSIWSWLELFFELAGSRAEFKLAYFYWGTGIGIILPPWVWLGPDLSVCLKLNFIILGLFPASPYGYMSFSNLLELLFPYGFSTFTWLILAKLILILLLFWSLGSSVVPETVVSFPPFWALWILEFRKFDELAICLFTVIYYLGKFYF